MAALVVLLCAPRAADAGGRRRVVVLEFEGEKAEKFHDAVVKLIKKTHTVINTDKWNGTAEEMSASAPNDKNIRKVAKKLRVDGVVEGKVEKRRDEYILRIKLRSGSSGEYVGSPVNTKAESTKLDGDAQKDIKDELVVAISDLEENAGGGGDDEKPSKKMKDDDEEKPSKKTKKDDDEEKPTKKTKKDDDEEKPSKKMKKDDDEEKPSKKFSKKDDEKRGLEAVSKKDDTKKKNDDEEKPTKKKAGTELAMKKDEKKAKKDDEEDGEKKPKNKDVAKKESDGEVIEADVESPLTDKDAALSPSQRAIDGVLGVSFNARKLSFKGDGDLGPPTAGKGSPPGYNGSPVAGALLDLTVYPLAWGHKSTGFMSNLGANILYDRVLVIKSKDPATGMTLDTASLRYSFGAAFRYPIGKGALAPVAGVMLRFGRQNFLIQHVGVNNPDVPNVNYTSLEPMGFFKYPVSTKLTVNASIGYMVILGSGQIQNDDQYGAASVTAFEGEVGVDYRLFSALFVRAALKGETIGFSFKGTGALSTNRDGDEAQDIAGARDTYLGGAVTLGYLF